MRTFVDIYKSYTDWLVEKTKNQEYSYNNLVERYDEQTVHVFLYKEILEKCYDTNKGMFYFCKFIIGDLKEIGYPNSFRYNSLLRKWHKLVRGTKYLAVESARGHGKSVFFSQILNIYDMFLFKFRRVILISASQEQANELLENMKVIIENNEWLVTKKDPNKWAGTRIGYNDGYVLTAGIGSEILGQHVDRIVIDDILRSDNKLSDQQIEDYIDMNLSPMLLNRNGQMILVGCVKKDTKVFTEDGICEISDLKKTQDKLETLNKNIYGIGGFNNAIEIFDNGIKKTKKIETEHGFTLECTPNHPVLVLNEYGEYEWKKADSLTYKDILCISFGQNSFGNDDKLPEIEMIRKNHNKTSLKKISKDLAYFIGMYVAEGSNYKENSITISNSEFNSFVENNDLGLRIYDKRKDNTHWSVDSRHLIKTMKKLGVTFNTCENKDIPKCVYKWKKELVVEFIRGYADGDGCVTNKRVKFTSSSKKLLQNLQLLLLNFGIVSSITEYDGRNIKRKTGFNVKKIRYDLSILSPYVGKYKEEIGFRFKRKQDKLNKLNDGVRLIPNVSFLLKRALYSVKKKTNIKNCHHIYSRTKNKFGVNKIVDLIIELERENADKNIITEIKQLVSMKYHYVKIKKIEDSKAYTLDFIIPNTHSFVSNGIMSHNTPKSDKDIFSEIQRRIVQEPKTPWIFRKYPAIINYEKKLLLCPDRFTWEQIMEKRLTMGALKFGREYQLEFFSRETSLFPKKMTDASKRAGTGMSLLDKADKRGKEWQYLMGVDVARSGAVSADYTVAIVLAYNSVNQKKQIVHMWREKGLKISEQAYYIAKIAKNFNNCQVLVEQNNVGIDMIDTLADDYNVGVETFVTGGKGQKKEELIRFLVTAFEHEQIIFPQQDEWSREQMSILEDELSKFCVTYTPAGNERFEGVGAHDDSLCEGTSIITLEGIKNIEDITTDDLVLTHNGRFKEVEKTMSKTCDKQKITIKPFGNISFSLTNNHKLFVINKPKNNIRKRVTTNVHEIESQYIDKDKHLLISPINTFELCDYKIDMIKYFPTTDGWEYNDKYYWNIRWKEKKYVRFIDTKSKDFNYFIGWYVGDGSKNSLVFHKKDKKLIRRITEYLEKLGINVREHIHYDNYRTFNFCCIPFQKFLSEECGKLENKKLPIYTQYLKPEVQKEIIKGYWDADGSIVRNRMTAHTISKELAFQVKNMFLRNGIVCNINEIKRHRYEVENRNQFVLEVSKYYKEKFFEEPQTTHDFGKSFIKDGYLISCVNWHISVKSDKLYNVYDLQVKEDRSYCPNGIAIRNCVVSLALANKATQEFGTPFAITNFRDNDYVDNNPYKSMMGQNRGESDLVRLIKMGVIK